MASKQTVYSHDATVAAFSSSYEFLKRVHANTYDVGADCVSFSSHIWNEIPRVVLERYLAGISFLTSKTY